MELESGAKTKAKLCKTFKAAAAVAAIVILIAIANATVNANVEAIVASTLRDTVWATLIEQNICPDC